MLQLYLNGLPAVIKKGTTFKLTRENPLYTSSGDYTLDVELPLRGVAENVAIFGHVTRPEMTNLPLLDTGNYNLITEGLTLSGLFKVTAVEGDAVKVQLLAGRSQFNARMKKADGSDKYIDEIKYPKAWSNLYIQAYGSDPDNRSMEDTFNLFLTAPKEYASKAMNGTVNDTNCVAYPIYSEADDAMANPRRLNFWLYLFSDKTNGTQKADEYTLPLSGDVNKGVPFLHSSESVPYPTTNVMAPQPFLVYILEYVIASAYGTINSANNVLRTDWRAGVFVANCRSTLDIAAMLPHWTYQEFITECENFFGVTVDVDADTGTASVVNRGDYIADRAKTVELSEVVDTDHTTEIDADEEINDVTAGNVGYNFPSALDATDVVPDDVRDVALSKTFATMDEMKAAVGDLTDAATLKEAKRYIYTVKDCTKKSRAGEYHCTADFVVREDEELGGWFCCVDELGPLVRRTDSRDLDTTLRIVPCRVSCDTFNLEVALYESRWGGAYKFISVFEDKNAYIQTLVTDDTRVVSASDGYDIAALIDGKEEVGSETAKREVLEVAVGSNFANSYKTTYKQDTSFGGASTSCEFELATSSPCYEMATPDLNFSLKDWGRAGSIGSAIAGAGVTVDTRVVHCFTFLDRLESYDPHAVYTIRGRRYVCQKLELSFTSEGIAREKKGYFYELN